MADSFDAYYQWLAIPPAEQPPDLYRLVGATKYETNLDVISYAVDQRMTHVRTFQVGKHVAESQRLLNELAHARLTLLDPEKKADYDHKLREKEHLRKDHHPAKLAVAKPLPKAVPLAAAAPGVFPTVPDAKPAPRPSDSG